MTYPLLIIFCFSIIQFSISTVIKDNDFVALIYYEYSLNTTEINLTLLNRESDVAESESALIAYMKGGELDKEIYDFYNKFFNHRWIFFTDNSSVVNELLLKDFDNLKMSVFGIIVPKNLSYEIPENNKNKDLSIYEIDDNYTEIFKNFDVRNNNKNTYFVLKVIYSISTYPENYLLILSIGILLCPIWFLIFWKIIMKTIRNTYVFFIHKILYLLMYFNLFLGIVLLIKAFYIRGTNFNEEVESTIFIDVAIISLNGVYRTILWMFILIFSMGYGISLQRLSRNDFKYFLKSFVFIYIVLCMDQIIDSLISIKSIFGIFFHVSEIKNLVFYIIILIILLQKQNKNIAFLKRKLYYAQFISPEFTEAISVKICLIKKFRILVCFYLPLFLTTLVLHKTVFYEYDGSLLELYDYLIADQITCIFVLILVRPKVVPQNYSVDLGDDINAEPGNLYKFKCPDYYESHSVIGKITSKQVNLIQKDNLPIVIIGPNNTRFNGANDTQVNRYFNSVQIGFSHKQ